MDLVKYLTPLRRNVSTLFCQQGKFLTKRGCINLVETSEAVIIETPPEKAIDVLCVCGGFSNLQIRYNVVNESATTIVITQMSSLAQEHDTLFDTLELSRPTTTVIILFKTATCQLLEDVFYIII